MKSGPRDDLITIERNDSTNENDFGEPIDAWTSIGSFWVKAIYGNGSERRNTAIEGGDQSATFLALADSETKAVTSSDRIIFNDSIWDIVNIAPMKRDVIEFTAIRRSQT